MVTRLLVKAADNYAKLFKRVPDAPENRTTGSPVTGTYDTRKSRSIY
ncbi:MAG: hypothetical protein HQK89_03090 [Nitrospirae bacterium]|nr:hypothetical protein [Nitrospirota bacterium]